MLLLAAQGLTDQGIAHRLEISLATVGTYWGRIRIKIGPLSRTGLVETAPDAIVLANEQAEEVFG